jgi:hypothetical protein
MKNRRKFYYIEFFLIILIIISCNQKIIIPATKDALLSSNMPDINYSGKSEAVHGKGFGIKKNTHNGYVTYPAMYLYSGDDEVNVKDSFIVGGFDMTKIKGKIKHASLKFYINYSSNTRKHVCVFVRPVRKEWHEQQIKYIDIYKTNQSESELTDIVESNEDKCVLIVFNIKKNDEGDFTEIPFTSAKRTISINVTKILKEWEKNKNEFYGFLIDPMWRDDFRYPTKDVSNYISDFGIIEIATTEWYSWDGVVPENFYLGNGEWINIINNAKDKIKYVPRLEITLE